MYLAFLYGVCEACRCVQGWLLSSMKRRMSPVDCDTAPGGRYASQIVIEVKDEESRWDMSIVSISARVAGYLWRRWCCPEEREEVAIMDLAVDNPTDWLTNSPRSCLFCF